MKKIISTTFILIASAASAQLSVSGRANMLFPTASSSWKDIKASGQNTYDEKGKNSVGYNVGLSLKVDLPSSLFPVSYTHLTLPTNREV